MSQKIFNGRVKMKTGTEANWALATNFIPLNGELCCYMPDASHAGPRFKVGDGTTAVNSLPFNDVCLTNAEIEEILDDRIENQEDD